MLLVMMVIVVHLDKMNVLVNVLMIDDDTMLVIVTVTLKDYHVYHMMMFELLKHNDHGMMLSMIDDDT